MRVFIFVAAGMTTAKRLCN